MKNWLAFAIFSLFTLSCRAQDKIFVHKKESILGKVVVINPAFVRYRRSDNPEGPIYNIPRKMVDSIIYQNGALERINYTPDKIPRPHHTYTSFPVKSNSVAAGYNHFANPETVYAGSSQYTPVVVNAAYLSYERRFLKNRLATTIIPFIGLDKKAYGGGINIKFYPLADRKMIFGFGPKYVLMHQAVEQRKYVQDGGYYVHSSYEVNLSRYFMELELQSNFWKKTFIKFNLGAGSFSSGTPMPNDTDNGSWKLPTGQLTVAGGIGAGLRF